MVSGVTSHSCKWNKPSCGGLLSWLILQVAPLALKKGKFPALESASCGPVMSGSHPDYLCIGHHKLICHRDYAAGTTPSLWSMQIITPRLCPVSSWFVRFLAAGTSRGSLPLWSFWMHRWCFFWRFRPLSSWLDWRWTPMQHQSV